MIDRRGFCRLSALVLTGGAGAGCIARPIPVRDPWASAIPAGTTETLVNDVHSQLNPTHVHPIVKPRIDGRCPAGRPRTRAPRGAPSVWPADGMPWAASSSRDACVLLDTRDAEPRARLRSGAGPVTVEGGIQWPELITHLQQAPGRPSRRHWGIVQKQTGADRLSLGGALACNAHGRGLALKPIVDQVRWFDLVDANGTVRRCSRTENAGAVQARHRRLRTVRCHRPRAVAAASPRQGSACRRTRRDVLHHRAIRGAHPGRATSMATTSSRPTHAATASCAAASSPPTSRSSGRHAAHAEPDPVQSRGLGAPDDVRAPIQAARLRGVLDALPRDVRPDLLGRLASSRRPTSTTTTPTSTAR